MSTYLSSKDLAGEVCFRPHFFQTRVRINYLVEHYLSLDNLRDRLEDLPKQWQKPTPRIWQKIDWHSKKRKLTSYFRDSLTHFRATLHHMMTVLSWNSWTSIEKIELIYTFLIVWQPMHYWSTNLTSTYLEQILNSSDLN
ncbi:MAG: hypothetical protein AB4368_00045 [Xenococcaceae cyanobacterium]